MLRFDAGNPASAQTLKTYFPATIRAASYPSLLSEDIPGIAVKAFLVTYDYKLASSVQRLTGFARSLCHNFTKLQAQGHPKWREVELALPELGRGWSYSPPVERELRNCIAGLQAAKATPACTQQSRVLGLCK